MSKYVMIDLEMCIVPRGTKGYCYKSEIIEIGAVLMDENREIIDGFCTYVCPHYGYVDSKIQRLTGICQKDLIGAPSLEKALMDLAKWLPMEDTIPVSWSKSDEKQMCMEMMIKGIRNPRIEMLLDSWIDCQPMFAKRMGNRRQYKLSEALVASDIITEGREHDGLDDAYNTALLYQKLVNEPDYALNPYYSIAHGEKGTAGLGYTIGEVFANVNLSSLAAC